MLTPSEEYQAVDPADYIALGSGFPRGDARRVMSRSELKRFAWCPSRWLAGSPDEESDSMEWGSLIDCLALTPNEFPNRYAVAPATYTKAPAKHILTSEYELTHAATWNPRTKVCQDWKKQCEAEGFQVFTPEQFKKATEPKAWNWTADVCSAWWDEQIANGKTPIKADEESKAHTAVTRLFGVPKIAAVLKHSRRQVAHVVDYHDSKTGLVISVKVLIDCVPGGEYARYLADLKTTKNAHPSQWAREVFSHWLDAQAALYLDAHNACTGEQRDSFVHLKQENFPPYETATSPLSEDFIVSGRARYLDALASYCQCLATGVWPDYDAVRLGSWSMDEFGPVCEPEPYMVLTQL